MSIREARGAALLTALAAGWWGGPAAADVTECTNLASVPTVIRAPGVYCLKQDVASSSTVTTAVDIQASNVTLDCNSHRIAGRSAGPGTLAVGVFAIERSRITVRNCSVQGFRWGIALYGNDNPGSGHLVEDNLLEFNTEFGIFVTGRGSIVRGNRVIDTGGKPGAATATAITVAGGDAIDNVVDGVHGPGDVPDFQPQGLYVGSTSATAVGVLAERNRVRNLVPRGASEAQGIVVNGYGVMVRQNVIAQDHATAGTGVVCNSSAVLTGNLVTGFTPPFTPGTCLDAGGNVSP